jgi:hypothetical protein
VATSEKRSWGWAILFGVLAASNIAKLMLGAGHVVGCTLEATGFIGMALAALYGPRGFLAVSWRQLSAPSKLGRTNLISVVAVALLVFGTAMQWLKI